MRYCKQRDSYSCGLVAVLNSMKWVGVRVSYDWVKPKQRTRGFSKILGIGVKNLSSLLRRSLQDECDIRFAAPPTYGCVKKHLEQGGIIILCSAYNTNPDTDGHYFLLTDVTSSGKTYTTINLYLNQTVAHIRSNTLRKHLSFRKPGYPRAWFLRKL